MEINFVDFYSRLGTIAVILALGFLLGKLKLISAKTNKDLVNLLLTVFMPASLFMAFPIAYSDETSGIFIAGLVGGFVVMIAIILLSLVIFNKKWYKGKLRYESQFSLVFNNATFLGYPIISSTFGPQSTAVIAYCGFIIAFNIALFSYGVYLFKHKVDAKLILNVITNPNIIAVVLGVVVFLTSFQVPSFLNDAVKYTSGATTALSIICVGFMLSTAKFSELFKKWKLAITALIQLIIGPLATYLLLIAIKAVAIAAGYDFPDEVVVVCTLIQALPTATSLGLFASKYGGDEKEASQLVTMSTLFSIVTLPIMVGILLIH
ncbi:AEC family transporter [Candidatus Saccharibacteria bacterium]|nr:AEC family transporter [Candidatus Saccharibacteria bacterium]